jgi:hypothetical protein
MSMTKIQPKTMSTAECKTLFSVLRAKYIIFLRFKYYYYFIIKFCFLRRGEIWVVFRLKIRINIYNPILAQGTSYPVAIPMVKNAGSLWCQYPRLGPVRGGGVPTVMTGKTSLLAYDLFY